jgi:hypothetical protein
VHPSAAVVLPSSQASPSSSVPSPQFSTMMMMSGEPAQETEFPLPAAPPVPEPPVPFGFGPNPLSGAAHPKLERPTVTAASAQDKRKAIMCFTRTFSVFTRAMIDTRHDHQSILVSLVSFFTNTCG